MHDVEIFFSIITLGAIPVGAFSDHSKNNSFANII